MRPSTASRPTSITWAARRCPSACRTSRAARRSCACTAAAATARCSPTCSPISRPTRARSRSTSPGTGAPRASTAWAARGRWRRSPARAPRGSKGYHRGAQQRRQPAQRLLHMLCTTTHVDVQRPRYSKRRRRGKRFHCDHVVHRFDAWRRSTPASKIVKPSLCQICAVATPCRTGVHAEGRPAARCSTPRTLLRRGPLGNAPARRRRGPAPPSAGTSTRHGPLQIHPATRRREECAYDARRACSSSALRVQKRLRAARLEP